MEIDYLKVGDTVRILNYEEMKLAYAAVDNDMINSRTVISNYGENGQYKFSLGKLCEVIHIEPEERVFRNFRVKLKAVGAHATFSGGFSPIEFESAEAMRKQVQVKIPGHSQILKVTIDTYEEELEPERMKRAIAKIMDKLDKMKRKL